MQKFLRVQTDQLQKFANSCAYAFLRPIFQPRHQRNILFHGEMRKKPDFLYHVPNPPPQLNRIALQRRATFHQHRAFARLQHPVDHFQRRGFSRSAASQQHQRLAALHHQT